MNVAVIPQREKAARKGRPSRPHTNLVLQSNRMPGLVMQDPSRCATGAVVGAFPATRPTRGVALMVVLGVAVFASIVAASLFSSLRQVSMVSRNFGQRITAAAWNDRILARIAAITTANAWERRFFRIDDPANANGFFFDKTIAPFDDLAADCRLENVEFEGAILDVPGEKIYRVKLNVRVGENGATYSTFTECRFTPGLLDMANRGVSQTMINLQPGDVNLYAADFAESIRRLQTVASTAQFGMMMPAYPKGDVGIPTSQVVEAVETTSISPPNPFGVADDVADLYGFLEPENGGEIRQLLNAMVEVNSAPAGSNPMSTIKLPNGQSLDEFVQGTSIQIRTFLPFGSVFVGFRNEMSQNQNGIWSTPTDSKSVKRAISVLSAYSYYRLFGENLSLQTPTNDSNRFFESYIMVAIFPDEENFNLFPFGHVSMPQMLPQDLYPYYKVDVEKWNSGQLLPITIRKLISIDFGHSKPSSVQKVELMTQGRILPPYSPISGGNGRQMNETELSQVRTLMDEPDFPKAIRKFIEAVAYEKFEKGLQIRNRISDTLLAKRDPSFSKSWY